jgi:hypothetical protein
LIELRRLPNRRITVLTYRPVPEGCHGSDDGPGLKSDMDGTSKARLRRSLELRARLPQQPAGDDELLDLLGALEDVHDLGVSGPLLQQFVFCVAD